MLFELSRPLDELEGLLLKDFAGRTLTVDQIYESHSVGKRFIRKNYKDVLLEMEDAGRIEAYPSSEERRKQTMADRVRITFPPVEDSRHG